MIWAPELGGWANVQWAELSERASEGSENFLRSYWFNKWFLNLFWEKYSKVLFYMDENPHFYQINDPIFTHSWVRRDVSTDIS